MTLALTANIILATVVIAVIVGMLGFAIRTSMPRRATPLAPAPAPRRSARARSLGGLARQS